MGKDLHLQFGFTLGDLRAQRRFCRTVAGLSSFLLLTTVAMPALAGTSVLGGDAMLTGAARATLDAGSATDSYAQFVANAGAKSAVLDWSKFNVGAGKEMNFSGAGTTFFNLVDGAASKSQIDGLISGNGSVWVINPNGIAFGANAQVNVGGLFAAAAGNLSNADQLRDGTATLPTFSSFDGTVDGTKGVFSAEQVALLGKRVELSREADFSDTLLLTAGGGTSLTVDTVSGGKVTIDVDTAAEFAGEAISVDGLLAGNAFVEMTGAGDVNVRGDVGAGDLSVNATGTLSVQGDVSATIGDVQLASVGSGDVALNGSIASSGEVALMAVDGDVSVTGSVKAEHGVNVSAGLGYSVQTGEAVYNQGSVLIGEKASVLNATDGNVQVLAVNGTVRVGQDAEISNGSGDGLTAVMTLGEAPAAAPDVRPAAVTVDGRISGKTLGISTESGDVVVNGALLAEGDTGNVVVKAATDAAADGKVVLNGSLDAGDTVAVYAGYGKIMAQKDTVSGMQVTQAASGSPVVADAAPNSIVSMNGRATLMAGKKIILEGESGVRNAGTINAIAADLAVDGHAGNIDLYSDETGIVIVRSAAANADGSVHVDNPNNYIANLEQSRRASKADAVFNGWDSQDVEQGDVTLISDTVTFLDKYPDGMVRRTTGNIIVCGEITAPTQVALATDDGEVIALSGSRIIVTDDGNGAQLLISGSSSVRVDGDLVANKVTVQSYADLTLGENAEVAADSLQFIALHDLSVDGTVNAGTVGLLAAGDVSVGAAASVRATDTADVRAGAGDVSIDGAVTAGDLARATSGRGSVSVKGTLTGDADAFVESESGGSVRVDGAIVGGNTAMAVACAGGVTVNGEVVSRGQGDIRGVLVESGDGDIVINGSVRGEGTDGIALVAADRSGKVVIGERGLVSGQGGVTVKTDDGDLVQRGGGDVAAQRGYAPAMSLNPALSGEYVVLKVNGSVGGQDGGSLAIDGKVLGQVAGNASLAAAFGGNLQGGTKQSAAQFVEMADSYIGLDLASLGDNTAVETGGDLSIYTAAKTENYTSFYAGGNLSVSAGTFGDLSYMRADGTLTINNVGKPAHPQIAYFESVNGKEPTINNQPNDTVIFVNGRLAGGNLKILNQFGANEAFMVSTPELKSAQGIFGNPIFLHSDLDVANPLEIGTIDYMLQETPRLTLDKEFPKEVDSHVDSVVVPEKDSIQFGRGAKDAQTTAADDTVTPAK